MCDKGLQAVGYAAVLHISAVRELNTQTCFPAQFLHQSQGSLANSLHFRALSLFSSVKNRDEAT